MNCAPKNGGPQPRVNAGRGFSPAPWDFVKGQLDEEDETGWQDKHAVSTRLQVTLRPLFANGLSPSEVVGAWLEDLPWVACPAALAEPFAG